MAKHILLVVRLSRSYAILKRCFSEKIYPRKYRWNVNMIAVFTSG